MLEHAYGHKSTGVVFQVKDVVFQLRYFVFQVNLEKHLDLPAEINPTSGRPGQILSAETRNRKTVNRDFPEVAPGTQIW